MFKKKGIISLLAAIIIAIVLTGGTTLAQDNYSWNSTGGPPGGEVCCFLEDEDIIYAGTINGIWKKDIRGWADKPFAFSGRTVYAMAYAPNGDLYAGINVPLGGTEISLWIMDNEGVWRPDTTGWPAGYSCSDIVFAPNGDLYAAAPARNNEQYPAPLRGVWKRDANGDWGDEPDLPNKFVWYLEATPNGDVYVSVVGGGVYGKPFGGEWGDTPEVLSGKDPQSFAVSSDGDIYASGYNGDGGQVWKKSPGGDWSLDWENDGERFVIGKLAFSPINGDLFLTSSEGIYRKSEGRDWVQDGFFTAGAAIVATRNEEVYVGGLYYESWKRDSNGQWEIDDFYGQRILSIAVDPSGDIYTAAIYNGIWKMEGDYGWEHEGMVGKTWPNSTLRFTPNGDLYASLMGPASQGIWIVPSGGEWPDGPEWNSWPIYCLAFTPDDNIYLGCMYSGVWKKTPHGEWADVDTLALWGRDVYCLAVGPDGSLYAGVSRETGEGDGGVWKSDPDDDKSWSFDGLENICVRSLTFTPNGDLYAGAYRWTTNGSGVWRKPAGRDWGIAEDGLEDIEINALVATPDGQVYAGTDDHGIWRRNIAGLWAEFNDGLPEMPVTIESMFYDSLSSTLFAGLYGNSVWKVELSTGIDDPDQEATLSNFCSLSQNYPNPFNATTSISYQLPAPGHVSIKVYDIRGREISTLVDNPRQAPGSYTVSWDGKNNSNQDVASGMYFYRIVSNTEKGKSSLTGKMVLLK